MSYKYSRFGGLQETLLRVEQGLASVEERIRARDSQL